ncbi:MAG: ATP phosphoribosyltransferase [Alphaproteobacteria bacterium TMED87]|nr:ATP phosphoribosyltransferase [Rhodospirillaceae bacterium]OUV08447.1 MAG: ATP phosphoribosyltransferase [Alphaproteobacteria bacterium TMED87]|tara:strand:+ start:324 stop:983 length:660 start_codon:yes stop_codon:yes gene_type:complete
MNSKKLIIAMPKGRILKELRPLLDLIPITPENDFDRQESRKLHFETSNDNISFIKVRSFDVATFVAFGSAHIGIVGSDVLQEFNYSELYSPLDLNIGKCSLCLASTSSFNKELSRLSHIRVATKYPETTKEYFFKKGIQAECIKINGAVELAPKLGLSSHIVDLVSTGNTIKENGLVVVEKISDVSTRLVVNRSVMKTRPNEIKDLILKFRGIANGSDN